MKLELGNNFLDKGDIEELFVWKRLGEHSRLFASVYYAEVDIVQNLADLMGQFITCRVQEGDIKEDLFKGIITDVELVGSESEGLQQTIQVSAYSDSIRMDLVPRNRVFQDPGAVLGDIVDRILAEGMARGEKKRGNFSLVVPLSVQYGETDFKYLKRLLGLYGIPVIVDDVRGVFYCGNQNAKTHEIFKKNQIGDVFEGSLEPLLGEETYASAGGQIGELQSATSKFANSLTNRTQYFSSSIHPESEKRQKDALSVFDMSQFSIGSARRKLRTKAIFMGIGDKARLEGEEDYSVLDALFRFSLRGNIKSEVYQIYTLVGLQELPPLYTNPPKKQGYEIMGADKFTIGQDHSLSLYSENRASIWDYLELPWQSRIFVAEVTKNEGDPESLGRIQVRFDWEDEGPEDSRQCWVDVMTPFAGSAENTSGFLMLPEIGEKVLVRFIELWDDKPVVIGSLRRKSVVETLDTSKHKVIMTPSGSCIDLVSDGNKDTLRLRAGKSNCFNMSVQTEGGQTRIKLECNDSLLIKGKDIKINGQSVAIDSKTTISMESGAGIKIKSPALIQIKGNLIELN